MPLDSSHAALRCNPAISPCDLSPYLLDFTGTGLGQKAAQAAITAKTAASAQSIQRKKRA